MRMAVGNIHTVEANEDSVQVGISHSKRGEREIKLMMLRNMMVQILNLLCMTASMIVNMISLMMMMMMM